jgi:hypothetical protein
MSKESLRKQADRAETIADQTVDDQLKETLTEAAKEYRLRVQSGPRGLIARGAAARPRARCSSKSSPPFATGHQV